MTENFNYGPIPEACYDQNLSRFEIYELLLSSYSTPERVAALAQSADPMAIFRAKLAIEINAEIDSETIWWHNYSSAEDAEQRKQMLKPKEQIRMAEPSEQKFQIKWSLGITDA